MKLGTRPNEHRNSVQVCDLESAVAKHAKDADHSIEWASVKIIGQEKPPTFTQAMQDHKRSQSTNNSKQH